MHGAGGGAPKGNRNGLKHGEDSAETRALKREMQALARLARETMAAIGWGAYLPSYSPSSSADAAEEIFATAIQG
jgi:hypothetical protein